MRNSYIGDDFQSWNGKLYIICPVMFALSDLLGFVFAASSLRSVDSKLRMGVAAQLSITAIG